jgi:hypothetical protein
VSTAYDPSAWTDLFVATAGASAALTGLVFVAVSINIQQILRFPGLPERAMETLTLLMGAVVVSIVALIPNQGATALGVELLVIGAGLIAAVTVLSGRSLAANPRRSWRLERLISAYLGTVPFAIGGVSLLAETGGGLYWVVGGVLGALISAVINAWVLLVEILR